MALKHIENEMDPKKKKKATPNLMKDERFKALFENPDFQVDFNSEEYALLNPVISQMNKTKKKVVQKEENVDDNDDAGKIIHLLTFSASKNSFTLFYFHFI